MLCIISEQAFAKNMDDFFPCQFGFTEFRNTQRNEK